MTKRAHVAKRMTKRDTISNLLSWSQRILIHPQWLKNSSDLLSRYTSIQLKSTRKRYASCSFYWLLESSKWLKKHLPTPWQVPCKSAKRMSLFYTLGLHKIAKPSFKVPMRWETLLAISTSTINLREQLSVNNPLAVDVDLAPMTRLARDWTCCDGSLQGRSRNHSCPLPRLNTHPMWQVWDPKARKLRDGNNPFEDSIKRVFRRVLALLDIGSRWHEIVVEHFQQKHTCFQS